MTQPAQGAIVDGLLSRGDDIGSRLRRAVESARRSAGYRLLVGHDTIAGQTLSDLSLRTQYVHLTDELIVHILRAAPDVVIFLDKSARPVSWLVAEFWGMSALAQPEAGAPVPSRPRFCYLNIDREQWRDRMDPDSSGLFDVRHVPADAFIGLRRAFIPGDASGLSDNEVLTRPTMLTGRQVLVVDEVAVSGDTLRIAQSLIALAFPDAQLSASHWMTPRLVTKGESRFNNQVPVWYRDNTPFGRLIGDRDPMRAMQSRHWRTRAGAWFLSLPHGTPDAEGIALRREITNLAGDVLLGNVPLIGSFDRDDLDTWSHAFTGRTPIELREWREEHGILLKP